MTYLFTQKHFDDQESIRQLYPIMRKHELISVSISRIFNDSDYTLLKSHKQTSSYSFLIKELTDEDATMLMLQHQEIYLIKLPFNTDIEFFKHPWIIYNRVPREILIAAYDSIRR